MKYSYQEARRLGLLASRQAKWRRKDPYLPSFEQRFGNAKRKEVPVGLMEVPVSMIEGTFSNARRESFAPNFMPLLDENTEFGSKWARLLTVQEEEGFTDPIIVYEFNHRFYVAEGQTDLGHEVPEGPGHPGRSRAHPPEPGRHGGAAPL
ncbi:MAG: hypothetical protein IIV27_01345 [Clostridia bacterium]|nr:hypothetical protein [Clostridia bacterium]